MVPLAIDGDAGLQCGSRIQISRYMVGVCMYPVHRDSE